jgi:hypothetical protein
MFITVFNYLCMFYSTNEDIRFFVSWGRCAGQRYGAAGDRVGDSITAASSRLFLAGYDSGSGQANGIGRSQRVFNGRTPADRRRTVRVKTSNTCVIIESCVQCTSSTVVRIGTILLIVEVVY